MSNLNLPQNMNNTYRWKWLNYTNWATWWIVRVEKCNALERVSGFCNAQQIVHTFGFFLHLCKENTTFTLFKSQIAKIQYYTTMFLNSENL